MLEIIQREDGFSIRFHRKEEGLEVYTDWFGPFPSEDWAKGAAWALFFYGSARITVIHRDEKGERRYQIEEEVYENFNPFDLTEDD